MKKLIILFLLGCTSASAQSFEPKKTYVLIAGVLKWKDSKSLSPFSDVHRKDEELKNQLVKMGVPETNIVMLLDEKATLAAISSSAQKLSAKCTSTSTFIFYYAGHGIKRNDGYYFANYDINTANCKQTGLDLSFMSDKLLSINKSGTIILWADCCYSGALIEQGKKISKKGRNVVVFSSATASNTSTGNWTFTQTLLDCFSAGKYSDTDGDGTISAKDIQQELKRAMKYREHQLNGFYNSMNDYVFIKGLNAPGETMQLVAPDSYGDGEYAYGLFEKKWQPVRILNQTNSGYNAQFYFYSDYKEVDLGTQKLKQAFFPEYKTNDKVKVSWEGKKYEATILEAKNDFYYIKYDGYDDSWNEWVMYDRISTGKEKRAQIEENGTWYPGEVLSEKNGKYFIRYDGFDYSWDEWVGPNRIKLD